MLLKGGLGEGVGLITHRRNFEDPYYIKKVEAEMKYRNMCFWYKGITPDYRRKWNYHVKIFIKERYTYIYMCVCIYIIEKGTLLYSISITL